MDVDPGMEVILKSGHGLQPAGGPRRFVEQGSARKACHRNKKTREAKEGSARPVVEARAPSSRAAEELRYVLNGQPLHDAVRDPLERSP